MSPALALADRRVLSALAGDGALSFQGLRRLLGLHPQALSRILKRLREAGLVEEAEEGYRLAATPTLLGDGMLPALPVQQSAVLFSLVLEDPALAQRLRDALAGRWFGKLRWLGQARMGDVRVLAWIIEPEGTVIRLVLDGQHARIEVADEARSEPAAHEGVRTIMPALALALAPVPARSGPVATALPLLVA